MQIPHQSLNWVNPADDGTEGMPEGRACVPPAATAVCSSTEAALHSCILSRRFLLRDTGRVLEIAPPWLRTDLMNSREAERPMPLGPFIAETMAALGTDSDEILVEAAKPLRANLGPL